MSRIPRAAAGTTAKLRYQLTRAGGGAAFLIHHPAGNQLLFLGERFCATVPRVSNRLPIEFFPTCANL